jgi:hypothetical protein
MKIIIEDSSITEVSRIKVAKMIRSHGKSTRADMKLENTRRGTITGHTKGSSTSKRFTRRKKSPKVSSNLM